MRSIPTYLGRGARGRLAAIAGAGLVALAPHALAQDTGTPAPFDFGAAAAGDAQPAAAADKPAKTPEQAAADAGEVTANYDATLDIYSAILDRQETDPSMLERRIKANQELVSRYEPKLSESEQELRRTQVAYLNRVLELKRQRDRGELTEDQFKAQVEQDRQRYEKRKARMASDVEFYRGETKDARERLDRIGREHQAVVREGEMRAAESPGKPGKVDPATKAVKEVEGILNELGGFRIQLTMDGVDGLGRYDHLHGATAGDD
jgi:chromosome segregation ATPase